MSNIGVIESLQREFDPLKTYPEDWKESIEEEVAAEADVDPVHRFGADDYAGEYDCFCY